MRYIEDLYIKRFRGIKDLELSDLGEVNILLGKNNSGKTSVLEAIEIIENPLDEGSIIRVGKKRELFNNQSSSYNIFRNMLNKHSNSIEINGTIKEKQFEMSIKGKEISVISEASYSPIVKGFEGKAKVNFGQIHYEEDFKILQTDKSFVVDDKLNLLPIVHIAPIDHLLENSSNEVIKKGKKKELIQLLSIFDKDIIGLEMVEENNKTVPYIEHKKLGLMPLSTYGDGLKRVLLLGSSIIKAEKGVLLIDEVETAIHIDAFVDVFKWFIKACKKYSVQVFMTTHSIEVIDSILEIQDTEENVDFFKESLRVITIKNSIDENRTVVRNLDGFKAHEAREDFGLELR